jgi:hypothetical protein
MIRTVATEAEMATYVFNIKMTWRIATREQMARGRQWYRTANDLATVMAEGNTRAGAGVIAALSPFQVWETNLAIAEKALSAGTADGLHVGDAIRKTERIIRGEDPLSVLPPDSKTWNFFRCIVDPDDAEAVVIDRHSHDVAVGERYGARERGLSNKRRYATVALAYRIAAEQLDEIPSTVQAVAWVAWREMED